MARLRSMEQRPGVGMVLGLGAAAVALALAGIVGAVAVGDDDGASELATEQELGGATDDVPGGDSDSPLGTTDTTVASTDTTLAGGAAVPGAPGSTGGGGTTGASGGSGGGGGGGGGTGGGGSGGTTTQTVPGLPSGGNTTGVTKTSFKYGVHAPVTFDKAPVPLAEPVLRGIRTHRDAFNQAGGINGRKLDLITVDDEFTTGGAARAADKLINDEKVFFLAGTLGVDQIGVVATEARKRGNVPYFAGGGHEPQFADLGVKNILSSYDEHVIKLADFMAKSPKYKGKRVGAYVSNTKFIDPVVTNVFRKALADRGMQLVISRTVQKPQEQTSYQQLILDFKNAKVEVAVPLTDPITTSRIIGECARSCPWTYAFSNFAHDGEAALRLFAGEWGRQGVQGLSGGCYPLSPQANDRNKCGLMGKGVADYKRLRPGDNEQQIVESAAGAQWIYFWQKAIKDVGAELTRERLTAAISRYEGYSDLITGPITYSSNPARGATKFAVYEAMAGDRYKMISDGLVDGF